ncbi:MAG: hypothetical protein IOC86_03060, partial [Aestuariivirga sp.]|nr:hypothetical protein [Aestuariivirga sp.]
TILSAIAALTPPGGAETYMPAGLIWGWNMLTSQDPLTRAHSPEFMQQNGGRRALVLMTDGINSVAPENRSSWRIINANNSTYRNWGPRNTSYTDHLTAQLCERIKADGIDVYTVAFTVDDADTDTLLRNCATDPGKFYKALTPNALFRAFDDIGDSLKRVRLAQ